MHGGDADLQEALEEALIAGDYIGVAVASAAALRSTAGHGRRAPARLLFVAMQSHFFSQRWVLQAALPSGGLVVSSSSAS